MRIFIETFEFLYEYLMQDVGIYPMYFTMNLVSIPSPVRAAPLMHLIRPDE